MPVDIVFLGSGGIAGKHMGALSEIDNARVVGCMDINEEAAAEAAARFPGAGAYTDAGEALDDRKPDAAYVCVPPHAHGELEQACIEREIPFFVEKPISNDRPTARKILEGVRQKDLLTGVGYMSRYRSTVEEARQALKKDEPVMARGWWIGGMPGARWWRQKEKSGGQIMEQTTHTFDLACYLFGDVETVFCAGRRGLITDVDGYDVEDASICTLVFESGLVCEISSSCAVECGGSTGLEIFCRNSHLKLSGWDLGLEIQQPGQTCRYQSPEDNIFEVEDQIWIDAVESGNGAAIKSTYRDAYHTQMVTCAANESMESGEMEQP